MTSLNIDTMLWQIPKVGTTLPPPSRAQTITPFGKRIYLFGGGIRQDECYNHVYVFYTRTYRWTCLIESNPKDPLLPCPRRAHTAVLFNDTMYIFGGGTGKVALNDLWCLNLRESSPNWIQLQPSGKLPEPRAYHTATVVRDTMIICGGHNGTKCFRNLYIYNFVTNAYTKVDTPSESPRLRRMAHTATAVGNKLCIFGGLHGEVYFNELWLFDLREKTWELKRASGTLPLPRGYHCAVYYDSRLFVFGGMNLTREGFNEVHVLEFGGMAWLESVPVELVR